MTAIGSSTLAVRIVIDTNVLVSALLKPGSVPDRALSAIWTHAAVLYDARIVDEYSRVLARPKFRSIEGRRVEALLATFASRAIDVGAVATWEGTMTDGDDRMFVEVALAGHADAIVTGNGADFPLAAGIAVLPPAALLSRLGY